MRWAHGVPEDFFVYGFAELEESMYALCSVFCHMMPGSIGTGDQGMGVQGPGRKNEKWAIMTTVSSPPVHDASLSLSLCPPLPCS